MLGIVDVGGGTRGVYSSGIYDCFLDRGFRADYCIGVSAGAANLITYVAGQKGRTYRFYREYFSRRECVGASCAMKNGSFLSLDYLYETLSNQGGEDPLDYHAFAQSDIIFRAVATRQDSGEAVYFSREDFALNSYAPLKASCCLPVVCKSVEIDGIKYYDGGMADPIPYKKALSEGCDRILVILTKPRNEYCQPVRFLPALEKFYDNDKLFELARTLHLRCKAALEELEELEKEKRVFILEPENSFGMKTLTKDKRIIDLMYRQGYSDGEKFLRDYQSLITSEQDQL